MIVQGDGYFQKLYDQGRCPKCRTYMLEEKDYWRCPACNMTHGGLESGNRTRPKAGTADDQHNQ